MTSEPIGKRVASRDWQDLEAQLDADAHGLLPQLLEANECVELTALYAEERHFRKRVVMARHNFGRGEYKYFRDPLPRLVRSLRSAFYPRLVSIANRWNVELSLEDTYPARYADYLARCAATGQTEPTPLLLRYGPGDYNCLHQDLYGDNTFPLQVAVLLSEPVRDFSGGEFVLTEQRPRMQSRPMVVPLHRGDAVVFPVHHRPVLGKRGYYRVQLRHGVSPLRSGERTTLGVIFHNAT